MPGLRELQNIARVEFNVPLNPGTKFRSYAEEWEVVKDKRIRFSKEVGFSHPRRLQDAS